MSAVPPSDDPFAVPEDAPARHPVPPSGYSAQPGAAAAPAPVPMPDGTPSYGPAAPAPYGPVGPGPWGPAGPASTAPWGYGAPPALPPYPPPPGTSRRWGMPEYDQAQPYHRILRTRNYRWWRPLVGLLVAMVTFVALSLIATAGALVPAFLSGAIDLESAESDPAGALVSDPLGLLGINLSLAAFIPAVMLGILAGHQLRPGWLHSVLGRFRWTFLLACLLLEVVITLVVLPLSALTGSSPVETDTSTALSFAEWLPFAIVILLTTPLQAAGEEYFFRGYGLQALGAWVRNPWFGIVVTSLLFAAAHGSQSPALFFNRFAFGMIAGWLTVRTGGLEAAIGIHVVNNLVILLLASAAGELAPSLSISEAPWGLALLDAAGMVVYAVGALWLARRMGVATTTRPTPPPPAWPQPVYAGGFGQPTLPR